MTVILELELHEPDARSTVGGGWIVPKRYMTDDNGGIRLTSHCAGFGEIDFQIDQMQRDLEELRRKAKAKFAAFSKMKPKPLFESN